MTLRIVILIIFSIFAIIHCTAFVNNIISTPVPQYSCKHLKDGHECSSAKIFIGLIRKLHIRKESKEVFINEISRFLSDCQLWNFEKINVTFADEFGAFVTCDNMIVCLNYLNLTYFSVHEMNEVDNNNTNDEMENSFKEFFHATPNDTLSMAYFLTDLSEHEWNQSKVIQNMIHKTDLFANIINKTPVYTKFIQYSEGNIIRPTCCRFTKLHEKAPYYFDELIILEKDIDEFRINGPRSYSLCKELPRNYTSSCKTETLKEEEHDKCTSWHVTVFLMLDRHRAKEKDIDKIQVLLRNIMNNCSTEQNIHLNIIIMGNPISITCFTETECNQKISDYVTIDKATTVWNNNSINIVIEKALQETIISLKEGFRYDANILYIISNVACYDQDEFYDQFKDKFLDYNYALALWTRQYRVITKLIMIDQVRHENTTCSDIIHPVIHITDEYLKLFEVDKKFERFEHQMNICPQVTDEENIENVVNVEKANINLIFIVIPIMLVLILGIAYAFKKCAPNDFMYPTKSRSSTNSIIDAWQIDKDAIEIYKHTVLGKGAFSIVYKGHLKNENQFWSNIRKKSVILALGTTKAPHMDVAIKIIHWNLTEQTYDTNLGFNISEYMREIRLMKQLGYHPHVLNLIGWMTSGGAPSLVLEYCAKGDLRHYLKEMRESIDMQATTGARYENFLGLKDLLRISCEVSDALVFLSSKKVIHRDVAARNVMLTDQLVAKLGDFGLCQYLTKEPYPVKCSKLPIKWMAIESLQKGEFSSKTDVWSFGVLLFEIFSIGEAPYKNVEIMKMLIHLIDGNRLEKPDLCSEQLYDLMRVCWNADPNNRPSFEEIRGKLSNLIGESFLDDYGYIQFLDIPEIV